MVLSLKYIFTFLLIMLGISLIFFDNTVIGISLFGISLFIAYREHNKNKRKSNKQKHTSKRSGKVYDTEQNNKRSKKNKKYKKKNNPNKK